MSGTAGLVLAAGAGRRLAASAGRPAGSCPKALLTGPDGVPWVVRAVRTLAAVGCDPVLVAVGARGDQVADLVRAAGGVPVPVPDWTEGVGASLRAGLDAGGDLPGVDALLVCLVDLPGVTRQVVTRLAVRSAPGALAQAAYGGVPGHPVLLGREHWPGVRAVASGDAGARAYLRGRQADAVLRVECGDVGSGEDVDAVADLPPGTRLPGDR